MENRVVVTGIGVITPLGLDINSFWEGLTHGKSAIDYVSRFDPTIFSSRVAGEIKEFNPKDYIKKASHKWMDRFSQFGVAASRMALMDAGLTDASAYENIGIILGNGAGGLDIMMEMGQTFLSEGPCFLSPTTVLGMANMASGNVAIELGLQGVNYTINSACASSGHAIGNAFDMIKYGKEKVVLAGGTEAPISKMAFGTFCALHALSKNYDNPKQASRPFDAQRDGFVLSEGACVLVLEELNHALERGVSVYAEIAGYAATDDANHITKLNVRGPVNAITKALKCAKVQPHEVNYINAHGTSTPANDSVETQAIKQVFKEQAYKIPVSSTKSMLGHLLGAAGAVELAATILTVKNNMIPPTINYTNTDPECDLDYVPNNARKADINVAMSNSFAFGGQNAVLVIKKYIS